jgi:hypothetical protein
MVQPFCVISHLYIRLQSRLPDDCEVARKVMTGSKQINKSVQSPKECRPLWLGFRTNNYLRVIMQRVAFPSVWEKSSRTESCREKRYSCRDKFVLSSRYRGISSRIRSHPRAQDLISMMEI